MDRQFVQLHRLGDFDDANARQAAPMERIVWPAARRAGEEQRTF
jgi:hypothetical protein